MIFPRALIMSTILVLLVISILLFLTEQANSSRCRLSREYEVYSVNKGYEKFENCLPCPHCPLGKGLEPECGIRIRLNNSTIKCKRCMKRKTYSNEIGIGSCKPCDECGNKLVLKNCTRKSKQICAETLCRRGYYFDGGSTRDCRLCSPCCVEKEDLKYNVRPRECADMPDNRNCKVTHHACSHKTTQTTTGALTTTITVVPSTDTPVTGSQATRSRPSTVRSTANSTATSVSNFGASTISVGTPTTNETTGIPDIFAPTLKEQTVVNKVTTSGETSPELVTETTRKALSSAQTGISVALSLVALVILTGVFLLRRYKRKMKVKVKERRPAVVEPLLNDNHHEMTSLHCDGNWVYELYRIPLDMKEKIGLMLDNAPPGMPSKSHNTTAWTSGF